MKTTQSFSHLLNEIFSELNNAACIRISYRMNHHAVSDLPEQEIILTGVNGFTALPAFTNYLSNCRAEAIKSITEELKMLEPSVKLLFLRQAINRCRRLSRVTIPVVAGEYQPPEPGQPVNPRQFFKPVFDPGNEPAPDDQMTEQLLRLTRRYASMWNFKLQEMTEELNHLCFLVNYVPIMIEVPGRNSPEIKIPVNASVELIAAFARLFFDAGLIGIRNKSQLCRLIAGKFESMRQKDVSWGNLRRHFQNPSPLINGILYEELCKLLQNFRETYLES